MGGYKKHKVKNQFKMKEAAGSTYRKKKINEKNEDVETCRSFLSPLHNHSTLAVKSTVNIIKFLRHMYSLLFEYKLDYLI